MLTLRAPTKALDTKLFNQIRNGGRLGAEMGIHLGPDSLKKLSLGDLFRPFDVLKALRIGERHEGARDATLPFRLGKVIAPAPAPMLRLHKGEGITLKCLREKLGVPFRIAPRRNRL